MKWFKRSLWLLAWACWIWLGFGLYRELPRRLGPLVRQLPITPSESVLGFVGDTSLVAILPGQLYRNEQVKLLDAKTGAFVREIVFKPLWTREFGATSRAHGMAFVHGDDGKLMSGFHQLNLLTGEWKRLSRKPVRMHDFHPTRSWLAFHESAPPVDKPKPITVLDWKTGAELFVRPSHPDRHPVGAAFFLGESDRLAVPVVESPSEYRYDKPTDFEIWRIGTPSVLEKVVRLPRFGAVARATSSGRVAIFVLDETSSHAEVYDLLGQRLLFSTPPTPRETGGGFRNNSHLSECGRTIMDGQPPRIWHVDDGSPRWEPTGYHLPLVYDSWNAYGVVEVWSVPRLRGWNTVAVRDFGTGGLRYRCWENEGQIRFSNRDGTLGIDDVGRVFELPYRVDWPLLALSQIVLALPLVLLWTALCVWKKRSRARRFSEAAQ
jgi:hypothetical protein